MKFLKGLALSLLSFLLFLSLSIFGFAFMLNNTVLSPDFITSELDRLEVSSSAEEFLAGQAPGEEFLEEFGSALVNTITKVEPLVKEQAGAAIYSISDYLKGKRENPDLALTLSNTLLSSDFVVSLVDELDVASIAGEFISEQLTEGIPEEIEFIVAEAIDDTLVDVEPWLKEQIGAAADPIVDYLLGESQSLSVVISTEPLVDSLKSNLWQALLESPPPELAGLPPGMIERQFDELFQEFSEGIPSTFEIDESLVGTDVPANIAEALAEAEEALEQARDYVGYFQIGYWALIGFMVLLVAGIVLIHRQVRGATLGLGIIFLTYGVVEYGGVLAAKYFALPQLPLLEIPLPLQIWISQFINNFLSPLAMFSLSLLIGGVVLIVVSFVYKRRQALL